MTPATELSVLIAHAAGRGISVIEMDAAEYAVSMRGAMTVAEGLPELRALLKRMGVQADAPPSTWADYERRKTEWEAANMPAPAERYDRAMRRIADELGL